MDVDDYRQLRLLTDMSSSETVTQRRLAKRYGLALGLTNFLIRRLVKKGYVKIVNLQRKRLRYLITPKGLAEKSRLTYQYLEYSLALYRHMRTLMTDTLVQWMRVGGTRVVIYGTGELAEIAFLALQERGLEVVTVVGEAGNDRTMFMNQPVRPLEVLADLSFDWVILATFNDPHSLLQQFQRVGVPSSKIATIPSQSVPDHLNGQATALDGPTVLMEAWSR